MAEITPEQIAENATKPQSATLEAQSASMHSLPDQIEAAKFAATQKALAQRSGWGAVRIAKAVPPGTID